MKLSKNNKILYFIICTALTVMLDTSLSDFITQNLHSLNNSPLSKIVEFTYYENSGAAFSIFQNDTLFLVIIAVLALTAIIYLLLKYITKTTTISLFFFSLLSAGIICNTYERLTLGFVRDYFNLQFINFPIFNISDILINLSVLAIMIIVLKQNKK